MRVVVAIDGSTPAELAIELTESLAWPAGTAIQIVQAVETGAALFGGPWPTMALVEVDTIEADLRVWAERTVADGCAKLARPGWTVVPVVVRGRPGTAIVDAAEAFAADLIVVGSRGHGRIESMLLGSVSAEVIDHAPVPVMVARGGSVDRVVLGWDGSSCASRAVDLVRTWPIFRDASIRVVSVAEVGVPWWAGFPEADSPEMMPMYIDAANASRQDRDQLAREMTLQLQAAGLNAEADPREGDAASGLLTAAGDWKADLVVVGTHGRTGLARLVIGGVARNVLHHATCSVLVVPSADRGIRSPKPSKRTGRLGEPARQSNRASVAGHRSSD